MPLPSNISLYLRHTFKCFYSSNNRALYLKASSLSKQRAMPRIRDEACTIDETSATSPYDLASDSCIVKRRCEEMKTDKTTARSHWRHVIVKSCGGIDEKRHYFHLQTGARFLAALLMMTRLDACIAIDVSLLAYIGLYGTRAYDTCIFVWLAIVIMTLLYLTSFAALTEIFQTVFISFMVK